MIRRFFLLLLALLVVTTAAGAQRRRIVRISPTSSFSFDFGSGTLGWEGDFADYNPASRELMNLTAELRLLPPEIGSSTAFYLSGANRSDDLFMFLRRRLTAADGIRPNQRYQLSYVITFASNAPTGCAGAGGAPGEAVYLKAGAAGIKPEPVLVDSYLRMNIDIGNQAQGGAHASVAGNIANGLPCEPPADRYVTLIRSHRHTALIQSSPQAELWLIIGTDSGFEGTTSLYYQGIEVSLSIP